MELTVASTRPRIWGARLSLALLLIASAAPALAQPAREGNIYDWRDHQPTEGSVQAKERAAGVAPPAAASAANGEAVDQLGKQLLHDEAVDPPSRESQPQLSEPPSQLRK